MPYVDDRQKKLAEFRIDQLATECMILREKIRLSLYVKDDPAYLASHNRVRAKLRYSEELLHSETLANRCMLGLLQSENAVENLIRFPSRCFHEEDVDFTKIYRRAYNILKCRYGTFPGKELYDFAFPEKESKILGKTIIFLDIDGVLNSTAGAVRRYMWDTAYDLHEENIEPFMALVDLFEDCEIVISSTWKGGYSSPLKFANDYFSFYPEIKRRIIGLTPNTLGDNVSIEICSWLKTHLSYTASEQNPRVIWIDDSAPITSFAKCFQYRTDLKVGFNFADYANIKRSIELDETQYRFEQNAFTAREGIVVDKEGEKFIDTLLRNISRNLGGPGFEEYVLGTDISPAGTALVEKDTEPNKSMTETDSSKTSGSASNQEIRFIDDSPDGKSERA